MKNMVNKRNQAALCLEDDSPDFRNSTEFFAISASEQTTPHPAAATNIIGLSEDLRFDMLLKENQRLKSLIEDLVSDKSSQARRIRELTEEKSRLKKAMADLIINNGN